MGKAPLIRSRKPGSLNLTGHNIDEILLIRLMLNFWVTGQMLGLIDVA